jgi:hypothetical protein
MCFGLCLTLWGGLTRSRASHPLNKPKKYRSTQRKACPTVNLSTTNPTRTGLGSNQDPCGGKQANNHLNHGTAMKHNSALGYLMSMINSRRYIQH